MDVPTYIVLHGRPLSWSPGGRNAEWKKSTRGSKQDEALCNVSRPIFADITTGVSKIELNGVRSIAV